MIDYQDWAESQPAKGPRKGNSSAIAALTQAQPAMETLTQSPQWDLFLSYIASAIETWEADVARLAGVMTKPLGIDDMLRVRHTMVRLSERVATARYISQLPKDLIDAGDEALSLNRRFDDGATS